MNIIEFITNNISPFFALVATGVFAGILAGLLGVGGGIVIVPVLFFLFQSFGVSPESAMLVATATSLATIVPTSVSSIRSHNKKGNVDFDLLKRWAVFILIGVLVGSWLVTLVEGTMLTMLFGVIAVLSALNMLFRTGKSALYQKLPNKTGQTVMGASIGFFSSMVGIGGGTISVPLLTLYNYPAHKAIGTAAAIGLIISLPGALTMLTFGSTPTDAPAGTFGLVNLFAFTCIVPLTVLFAPLGASLAAKLDAEKLKKIFAFVLLFTGLRMLAQLFL
ncbi:MULTISPECIES: sulfite exporter TauE/SafE family protein [unclassified Colwellia]|uniref:sulfite exporter TauE/SafE family protein n=1 Tax=unclassified Colwellia TaxID=196834 RepID=UPI0015F3B3A4|nr:MULTISPECIES: sulfite exporter TauE/SafE family protein [unclassified Colwellia]MBA6377554.1 sulfite exporter TauE/SafE family protein [Colwellia sp. BRX10-7]MBA6382384.1 sulfite exporter TauE/SafE family protein [Colwellia sp. BRX10-9]MBA6386426.1 sulfite exporter TauE/SafE family protein [Colwellia sp. BRX10-2]MBA6393038.1 sulfite exporter TauE/SafE family protein [Colwellia sp. BRX10-6]MBA6402174.1 sulfite exporter TauE/SafE family protein [Colwellia sp. BRX10-5]